MYERKSGRALRRRLTADQQRRLTILAISAAGLEFLEVWVRYFEAAGTADELELDAHLEGLLVMSDEQADILACVVNELIAEIPERPRAPYSHETVSDETG
jgi:uncharacterized metal-binding protein YceD (DUF177 family)